MSQLEIRRKIVHLALGIALAGLLFFDALSAKYLGIAIGVLGLIFFTTRRKRITFIDWILENFEREEDKRTYPGKGALFYLIGVELCIVLFPKDITIASVLILAFGDSIPNFVGMQFRRIPHPFSDRKFLEGSLAGLFAAFLAASFFVEWQEALIAAFVAMVIEGIDMKIGFEKIDDNLIIPIAAGITIILLRSFVF